MLRTTLAWIALCAGVAAHAQDLEPPADAAPAVYDLVIADGRVLDPESGVDGVRQVGILDGRIAEVSEQALEGRERLDAAGLAVAPGFVDLHAHGQDPLSYDLLARDGVTSALDLERGAYGVKGFLRAREGEARIHYGVSAGHVPARFELVYGLAGRLFRKLRSAWNPAGYRRGPADEKQIRTLVRLLGEQIDEGGIGIGVQLPTTPGATPDELRAVFELAALRGAPVFVRVAAQQDPNDLTPLMAVLEQAKATGATLHIVDLAASLRAATPQALAAIDAARAEGLLVTAEVSPYASDPEPADGAREAWVEAALRHPGVLVASDGMPMEKGERPRAADLHARVLGLYVRERGMLTLMNAVARMSWLPARRLEWCTPAMAQKGRIRAGADADLVIFDPATVLDGASQEPPSHASDGILHVLVSGTFVVRDGALVQGALPGKPLRSRVGLLRSQEQN